MKILLAAILVFMIGSSTGTAFAAAPLPPSGLAKKSVASTTITIVWKASKSSNISNYLIRRDGVQIASTPGSTLSYTDKGLKPATKHVYGIQAKNTSGQVSTILY